MALVNYGSSCSSEESNDESYSHSNNQDDIAEPQPKVAKLTKQQTMKRTLPGALALLGVKHESPAVAQEHQDNPAEHGGRIRSFKHERGNWATYVYIAAQSEQLEDVQEVCQDVLAELVNDLHAIEDLHISLSRTVVLQYHHIDSFVETLRNALEASASFSISFRYLHIYTNAERTRTFIAFKVDQIYFNKIHQLMSKVDGVMTEYRLQRFYEDPSFHISFLWCLGDNVALLNDNLNILTSAIKKALGESETFSLFIDEINCKSGNKEFTFKLK